MDLEVWCTPVGEPLPLEDGMEAASNKIFSEGGRGIDVQAVCPVCSMKEETIEHTPFHYPRAVQVWHLAELHGFLSQGGILVQEFLELLR